MSNYQSSPVRILLILIVFSLPFSSSYARGQTEIQDDFPKDLRILYETGFILQDRNDDNVIDFINTIIILPAEPKIGDLVSASNIAARLGFETSAMNLDLTGFDSDNIQSYEIPVIVIGKENRLTRFFEPGDIDLNSNLAPGQGWISFIKANEFFKEGGLFISGVDETGLISAANYASGRMPSIWKLKDKSYKDVFEQFSKFLEQREIESDEIYLNTIIVDNEKPGVNKLSVSISFDSDETLSKALASFNGKDVTAEKDEKRVELSDLEFSDVHRIEITLSSPGNSEIVNLLPEKPWKTTRNSTGSNKQSPDFTLSQLYTIDGIFRDTNEDLVSDEVISYFSLNGVDAPQGIIDLSSRIGLESAGIRLPIAQAGGEEEYPEQFGFPIIYGIDHYQVEIFTDLMAVLTGIP